MFDRGYINTHDCHIGWQLQARDQFGSPDTVSRLLLSDDRSLPFARWPGSRVMPDSDSR
jgi:hypothetical protein